MRRLPVFFVLDVSESMVGANHSKLEEGLARIVQDLRRDPHAIETVHLCVIAFAGVARTIVPLIELPQFGVPELPIGSGTALGAALDHLMWEIDRTKAATSPGQKGDWKPLAFLMTDGFPTDDAEPAIRRWVEHYSRKASLVAISIGEDADLAAIRRLTTDVFVYEETSGTDLTSVTRWISQSIQACTRIATANATPGPAAIGGDTGLRKVDLTKPPPRRRTTDERFVVVVGQCQRLRLPYIMKYARVDQAVETSDPRLAAMLREVRYELATIHPLRRSYFEMSCEGQEGSIALDLLQGTSACPHCHNPFGLAVCGCGRVFCISGPGEQTCPWCKTSGTYGLVDAGRDDINISRSQG